MKTFLQTSSIVHTKAAHTAGAIQSCVRWGTAALVLLAAGRVYAQDDVPDSIRQLHMVHVSPHLIVFDPQVHTATLTFSNVGETPTEADVVIQYGFTVWQNRDTVLLSPQWSRETPHDTVILNPSPQEHYAGRWLSGLPTHLTLPPYQTKQLTLHINPPKALPNGEYYARIVTVVGPHVRHDAKSQDTRAVQQIPVQGHGPPPLRDSVRVYYRQGPQSMGVALLAAHGQIDTTAEGNDSAQARQVGRNPLRNLFRVHLTGTTHFEGYEEVYYVTPGGQHLPMSPDISEGGFAFAVHTDGIIRDLAQTDMLTPGHYTMVIRFIPKQDEFPVSQRVPMDTAQVAIPFDVR
jgi:hypothetical protein